MAIVGLGTDVVEIERIEKLVASVPLKLAKRVLTSNELEYFQSINQPARYLAKRFAAKEAAAKALGTGIGRGVSFQHIEITNDDYGAPHIHFTGGAADRLAFLKVCNAHVTIADELHYAVATVILES
ncbi:holo-ACP synthase [Shewanella surugensis]|uniref:Holo-[acyl-carrier-protein] synthase n=1 Tax=Shewanella surugensis TaxID=212020 RepID=A0ABT0L5Y3_9GAMM|nr:holo-ACP synthase [Shewanella surugensis]MCL1123098.1 holo-ACP synthase [Shewanella surugensis]